MKKLVFASLFTTSLIFSIKPGLTNEIIYWDFGATNNGLQTKTIKKLNLETGISSDLKQYESANKGVTGKTIIDNYEQKIYLLGTCGSGSNYCFDIYDINSNSVTVNVTEVDGSVGSTSVNMPTGILKDSNGIVKVGGDANEIHIGENSWITKEENGRQKVYAKDEAGNPIPIDYTNGTKLLINGRDVEQSINNVGALSAALTGLPTVPTETTLSCGLGTGTHGGDFAFSGGCASKVNENLSINYAASMTMPGQDYAGDFENKFSARAGFVWKLGKSTEPIQISMKETNELKKEISELKQNNNQIISQNKALLARLERLEKVALSATKTKDLATIKLP